MGVDTKAIITKGTTIEQIHAAITNKYDGANVRFSSKDYFWMIFQDGVSQRQLMISYTNDCERENGIAGVGLSLGKWGNSVEIMRYLCETFGGYLDENDCDEEGYYPINFHLYEKGSEFTDMEKFKNKIMAIVGFEKTKRVMELFSEYQKITLQNEEKE